MRHSWVKTSQQARQRRRLREWRGRAIDVGVAWRLFASLRRGRPRRSTTT